MTDHKELLCLKLAKVGTVLTPELRAELGETLDYCLRVDRVFVLTDWESDLDWAVRTGWDKDPMLRERIDAGYFPDKEQRSADYLVITKPGKNRLYAVEALLCEQAKEILASAQSDRSADDRAREICGMDPKKFLLWTSEQWADLLGVSSAAIRKGHFWTVDRPKALESLKDK
jgi:hypothetical protein